MNSLIPCARCRRHHDERAERCPFCVSPTHRGLALALAFAGATSLASCARAEACPGGASSAHSPKAPDGGSARDAASPAPDAGRSEAGTARRARPTRPPVTMPEREAVPLYGDPPK